MSSIILRPAAFAAALFSAALLCAPARSATITVDPKGKHKTLKDALLAGGEDDTLTFTSVGLVSVIIKPRTEAPWGPEIWEVLPAGLAETEGVPDGRLLEIDGKPATGLGSGEATDLLRAGPPGSKARLKVERDGRVHEVLATREKVSIRMGPERDRIHTAHYFNDIEAARAVALGCADKGDMDCQKYVLRHGWDRKASAKHAERCALTGDRECQYYWGLILHQGLSSRKDQAEGARWLRRAADQGDPGAAGLLAKAYLKGEGVRLDKAHARYWRDKAAAGGYKAPYQYEQEELQALDAVAAVEKPEPLDEPEPSRAKSAKSVVSAADAPAYAKRAERPDDLAVVVGVENYPSLPRADWAERDADAVKAHLLARGFPERRVFVLKGAGATRTALSKELEARLPSLVKKNSTVFFYFSGHGSPDPKTGDGYLVPFDGDPKFLAQTGYPLKALYAALGALPAKRVVVALDSCFSGAGGRSVLPKGTRPLVAKTKDPVLAERVIVLTASASDEISGSSDAQGHGLFTYHLLMGLNEGKTNLRALADYLRPKVQDEARRENRDQTPQLFGAGAGEVEL